MNVHDLNRELAMLARRQHGVVQRTQVLALGFTPKMIAGRLKSKAWIRLAPSVYALASHPPTWRRQYKAAQLVTRGSAIACLPAAHLLKWSGFSTARPEVVASHTTNHRNPLATVHRGYDVKTTTVDGILVTTHAQTACDLLSRIRLDRWEQCVDQLLLKKALLIDDLVERREAYELSRRPGLPLLRDLVAERATEGWIAPESELETLLRSAVALVPGCPTVRWQAPAPWDDTRRLDGIIDAWGLVLEADGRAWHARVQDFDNDRWRDNQAAACGLRVQRFTYAHLSHRRDEVIAIIERAGLATNAA